MLTRSLATFGTAGVVALWLAATVQVTQAAMTSVYTDLETASGDAPGCETLAASDPDEGGEWASVRCPGPGGVWAHIEYADARDAIRVGEDGTGTPFLSDFTSFGPKIEWRLTDGAPTAMIVRMHVGGSADRQAQWLTVHKVDAATGKGCLFGVIDARANRNANRMARDLADQSASWACPDITRIVGKRGDALKHYAQGGRLYPWKPDRPARDGSLRSGTATFAGLSPIRPSAIFDTR